MKHYRDCDNTALLKGPQKTDDATISHLPTTSTDMMIDTSNPNKFQIQNTMSLSTEDGYEGNMEASTSTHIRSTSCAMIKETFNKTISMLDNPVTMLNEVAYEGKNAQRIKEQIKSHMKTTMSGCFKELMMKALTMAENNKMLADQLANADSTCNLKKEGMHINNIDLDSNEDENNNTAHDIMGTVMEINKEYQIEESNVGCETNQLDVNGDIILEPDQTNCEQSGGIKLKHSTDDRSSPENETVGCEELTGPAENRMHGHNATTVTNENPTDEGKCSPAHSNYSDDTGNYGTNQVKTAESAAMIEAMKQPTSDNNAELTIPIKKLMIKNNKLKLTLKKLYITRIEQTTLKILAKTRAQIYLNYRNCSTGRNKRTLRCSMRTLHKKLNNNQTHVCIQEAKHQIQLCSI